MNDIVGMECRRCREAISARLDGEATDAESAAVDAHLRRCVDCQAAQERAEQVTRMARAYAVDPGPGWRAVLLAALERGGPSACGCAPTCSCGCQSGQRCRCGPHVAA